MLSTSDIPSTSGTAEPAGVNVAIESQQEWLIESIAYDGTEKYIPPPRFNDILAKNVLKVPWKSVIGSKSLLDNRKTEKDAKANAAAEKSSREVEGIEPVAGPWAPVAKYLCQSMQEIDVLLDTLRIAKTDYMNAMQIAGQPESQDNFAKSKGFLWVSRRKAFEDAVHNLDIERHRRSDNKANDKALFFAELKQMRETWRVKKVNESIFGDLGYHVYGPKFAPAEIFDVSWKPRTARSNGCVQVQLPRHLMMRTVLSVSIKSNFDDIDFNLDNQLKLEGGGNGRTLDWDLSLKRAQESLIWQDIFSQLTKESAKESILTVPLSNVLMVTVSEGLQLIFEKRNFPLDCEELPLMGDHYLTSALKNMFIADVLKPPQRPQLFVGPQTTNLNESLDLRGPQALSGEESASRTDRPASLLSRMKRIALHYMLVDKVVDCLSAYVILHDDPQLTWKWTRATSTFSMISATLTNQCYDTIGKMTFSIHIDDKEVHVIGKEAVPINCHGDMSALQERLNIIVATARLSSVAILCRSHGWQALHVNGNAFNVDGLQAPTFYACNQHASKRIFIQFYTDGRPPRTCLQTKIDADVLKNNPDNGSFLQQVNLKRVPGSSYLRKLEYLLIMLQH